jgi:hypothetical protein
LKTNTINAWRRVERKTMFRNRAHSCLSAGIGCKRLALYLLLAAKNSKCRDGRTAFSIYILQFKRDFDAPSCRNQINFMSSTQRNWSFL